MERTHRQPMFLKKQRTLLLLLLLLLLLQSPLPRYMNSPDGFVSGDKMCFVQSDTEVFVRL